MATPPNVNLWSSPEHALDYLRRADSIPHRTEGEAALLEFLPEEPRRILDIGSGGGRLLALVKAARRGSQFVALDFSPAMLGALQKRRETDLAWATCLRGVQNERGYGTQPPEPNR